MIVSSFLRDCITVWVEVSHDLLGGHKNDGVSDGVTVGEADSMWPALSYVAAAAHIVLLSMKEIRIIYRNLWCFFNFSLLFNSMSLLFRFNSSLNLFFNYSIDFLHM